MRTRSSFCSPKKSVYSCFVCSTNACWNSKDMMPMTWKNTMTERSRKKREEEREEVQRDVCRYKIVCTQTPSYTLHSLSLRETYTLQSLQMKRAPVCGRSCVVSEASERASVWHCIDDVNARWLSKCLNCSHLQERHRPRYKRAVKSLYEFKQKLRLLCALSAYVSLLLLHFSLYSMQSAIRRPNACRMRFVFYDLLLFVWRCFVGVVFTVIFYLSRFKERDEITSRKKITAFEASKTNQNRFVSEFHVALDSWAFYSAYSLSPSFSSSPAFTQCRLYGRARVCMYAFVCALSVGVSFAFALRLLFFVSRIVFNAINVF